MTNITELQPLERLAHILSKNEGEVISVNISSIVNKEVLSRFHFYSKIESALLTEFEGEYQMKSGLSGTSIYEGKGIVLNIGEMGQLFIDESARIEEHQTESNISLRIKDVRSSMHIHLQILRKEKSREGGNLKHDTSGE